MEFTLQQKSAFQKKLYVIDYATFKNDFDQAIFNLGTNTSSFMDELGMSRTTVTNMKHSAKKSWLNKYMAEQYEDAEEKGICTKYIFNIICKSLNFSPSKYILSRKKMQPTPEVKEDAPTVAPTVAPIVVPTTDLTQVINKFNEVLEKLDRVTEAIGRLEEVVLAINKVGNVQMQMLEYTKTIMDYSQTCSQNLKAMNSQAANSNGAYVKRR